MSAISITLSQLEVREFASRTDPLVRNILTVLCMEMNWDEPVQSRFRSTDRPIAIVAQWWAGPCRTGKYTVFGAVKVMLWYHFMRGMHLQLVTDCPLPPVVQVDLCQMLEEMGWPLDHWGAIEEGAVSTDAREMRSIRLPEQGGRQLVDMEPNDLPQRFIELQAELEVLRQRGRVLKATVTALVRDYQGLANGNVRQV